MMVERYPNLKEEIPDYEISSPLDEKLARWPEEVTPLSS
jgi:hypothetical protein